MKFVVKNISDSLFILLYIDDISVLIDGKKMKKKIDRLHCIFNYVVLVHSMLFIDFCNRSIINIILYLKQQFYVEWSEVVLLVWLTEVSWNDCQPKITTPSTKEINSTIFLTTIGWWVRYSICTWHINHATLLDQHLKV